MVFDEGLVVRWWYTGGKRVEIHSKQCLTISVVVAVLIGVMMKY